MDKLRFRVWNSIDNKFDYISKNTIMLLAEEERLKLLKDFNIELDIDFSYYKFSDIALNSNGFLVANLYDESLHETICLDNRFIIEQCTGLKDKNEILGYDGDIILLSKKRYIIINTDFGRGLRCIENGYINEELSCLFKFDVNIETNDINPVSLFEIIGNIHENPELLEM